MARRIWRWDIKVGAVVHPKYVFARNLIWDIARVPPPVVIPTKMTWCEFIKHRLEEASKEPQKLMRQIIRDSMPRSKHIRKCVGFFWHRPVPRYYAREYRYSLFNPKIAKQRLHKPRGKKVYTWQVHEFGAGKFPMTKKQAAWAVRYWSPMKHRKRPKAEYIIRGYMGYPPGFERLARTIPKAISYEDVGGVRLPIPIRKIHPGTKAKKFILHGLLKMAEIIKKDHVKWLGRYCSYSLPFFKAIGVDLPAQKHAIVRWKEAVLKL